MSTRLTRALLLRPARRVSLTIGTGLIVAGLLVAGTVIGWSGGNSPAQPSYAKLRLVAKITKAAPSASWFVGNGAVASGASCSSTPCAAYIGQAQASAGDVTAAGGAVTHTLRLIALGNPAISSRAGRTATD